MSGRRIPNYDPIAEALGMKADPHAGDRARAIDAARAAAGDPPAATVPPPRPRRPAVVTSRVTRDYCPKGPGHRWVVIARPNAAGLMVEACEACEPERFAGLSTIHPDNRDRPPDEHDPPGADPAAVAEHFARMRDTIRAGLGAGNGIGRRPGRDAGR